ncbi:hypothetical protein WJX77_007296 [Trebouxia sp. C0004]
MYAPQRLKAGRALRTARSAEAEVAAYADGQGITKDAATAWLRNTEAFKNRMSHQYKMQKTYHKITS